MPPAVVGTGVWLIIFVKPLSSVVVIFNDDTVDFDGVDPSISIVLCLKIDRRKKMMMIKKNKKKYRKN